MSSNFASVFDYKWIAFLLILQILQFVDWQLNPVTTFSLKIEWTFSLFFVLKSSFLRFSPCQSSFTSLSLWFSFAPRLPARALSLSLWTEFLGVKKVERFILGILWYCSREKRVPDNDTCVKCKSSVNISSASMVISKEENSKSTQSKSCTLARTAPPRLKDFSWYYR